MNIEAYRDWLRLNTDSDNTYKSYLKQINSFLLFSNNEITQEKINEYFHKKLEEKISKQTFNSIKYALDNYLKFLKLNFELPKRKIPDKKIKEFITIPDLNDIIKNLTLIFKDYEKITLLLQFMYYTGMRASEVVNLKIEDIDWEKELIAVKNTKGKHDRLIPFFNDKLFRELKVYTDKSTYETVFNLSQETVNYVFTAIKQQVQLKKFHPHMMRVSFAKYCWEKGLREAVIAMLLGHKSIDTTLLYLDISQEMMLKECKKIKI